MLTQEIQCGSGYSGIPYAFVCELRHVATLDSNDVEAMVSTSEDLITHLVLFSCGGASAVVSWCL